MQQQNIETKDFKMALKPSLIFYFLQPFQWVILIATVVICYCHLRIISSEMITVVFVCFLDAFFDNLILLKEN